MRIRALLVLFILAPVPLVAQGTSEAPVMEREVFEYPVVGRRDPFAPLSAGDELGPRFEDLALSGIIYSPQRGSVAVLVDRATERRYRVWEGDVIGGARLLQVSESDAEFLVTVFGVTRRDTLRLKAQDKE